MEKDDVSSLIRIADVFLVERDAAHPEQTPIVPMSMYFSARFMPDAGLDHTIEIRLTRPDGSTKSLGPPAPITMQLRVPGAPPGFNVVVVFGVVAQQTGIHYLTGFVDGAEVAKTVFSLTEQLKNPA